jgi:hypothetical protein
MLTSLVGDARNQLRAQTTLPRSAVDELLAPAEVLVGTDSWPISGRAYGLFYAPGCSIEAQLDLRVPPLAVVADRFVATPLVDAVSADDHFYVVAVEQHRARLLRGQRLGLLEIALPALPVRHDDAARDQWDDDDLLDFYRLVDRAVWRTLGGETAPLFVAGDTADIDRYRRANHYTHLAGAIALESTMRLGVDVLHNRLWPLAARALDRARQELIQLLGTTASAVFPDVAGNRSELLGAPS